MKKVNLKKVSFGLFAAFIACGFMSCFSLIGALLGDSETNKAVKVVYKAIPYSELAQSIQNVNSPAQGFIVEAYLKWTGMFFNISETLNGAPLGMNIHNENRYGVFYYTEPHQFEIYDSQTHWRIDEMKKYQIYIGVYQDYSSESWVRFIDRIEGLLTMEEAAALEAKQKAQKAESDRLAAEAKKKAEEEANRYDASKFTVVPANFKPADYKKADLFDAVAAVEKMPHGNGGVLDAMFNMRMFVSDVVFTSQNGTTITFKTADGAISQYMKIGTRSELTAGQKVRIYYSVTKNPLTEWNVAAIERL